MRRVVDSFCSLLIPTCILLQLVLAPYTKVEESFNIQATHDILTYGIVWKNVDAHLRSHYDHLTFTGPVPRTFVGPLLLAGTSRPLIWFNDILGFEMNRQLIGSILLLFIKSENVTRSILAILAILGLFNACCLISFRNGVAKAFGRNAANWYSLFQASQFHIMYYTSRTLPNFFAFGLTTLAARNLLPLAGRRPTSRSSRARQLSALSLLTAAGIIFRSELALLLAAHTLYLHLHPHIQLPLLTILTTGIISAISSLALTILIDTFFWRSPQPLWPELSAFIYNVYNGQSLNWGTSPWHFYLTSSLPRLLFNPFIILACIPFTLLSPLLRSPALAILIPNLAFILIYSLQPHKEWRFIIYTVPPFTAVAAAGASWIWTRRAKSLYYRGLALMLVASTMGAFVASAGMLAISRQNYPGAEALIRLHGLVIPETDPRPLRRVHMDTLACMTGITRFLENPPPPPSVPLPLPSPAAAVKDTNASSSISLPSSPSWLYDKTESPSKLLDPAFWQTIDYALSSTPHLIIGSWEVLGTVTAYAGLALSPPAESPHHREQTEFEKWMEMLQDADVGKSNMEQLGDKVGKVWGWFERVMRRWVTAGWWIEVRREEVLRILKRVQEGERGGVRWEMEMEVGEGDSGPIVGVDGGGAGN